LVLVLLAPIVVLASMAAAGPAAAVPAAPPSWSAVKVQQPSGSPDGIYFGNISCPTASTCWSAGNAGMSGGGEVPLMERLHKGVFELVSTPVAGAQLNGVSCATASDCWVAGEVLSTSVTTPILEHWNGTKWSKVATPNPAGTDNFLLDVSCVSTKHCYAVGGYGSNTLNEPKPLLEEWNGNAWAIAKAPPIPTHVQAANPTSLSCTSTSRCVAVGTFTLKNEFDPHVYSDVLHGKKWSEHAVPQPFHGTYAYAASSDVKCTSSTTCLMTGYAAPDANGRTNFTPEAWRYNGKSWKLLSLPKSFRKVGGALSDISCTSAKACWAVGYEYATTAFPTQGAMALRWSGGKSLSSTKLVQPAGRYNEFDAVGCVPHGRCYALGDSHTIAGSSKAFAGRAP
jgi:hypothetical protein